MTRTRIEIDERNVEEFCAIYGLGARPVVRGVAVFALKFKMDDICHQFRTKYHFFFPSVKYDNNGIATQIVQNLDLILKGEYSFVGFTTQDMDLTSPGPITVEVSQGLSETELCFAVQESTQSILYNKAYLMLMNGMYNATNYIIPQGVVVASNVRTTIDLSVQSLNLDVVGKVYSKTLSDDYNSVTGFCFAKINSCGHVGVKISKENIEEFRNLHANFGGLIPRNVHVWAENKFPSVYENATGEYKYVVSFPPSMTLDDILRKYLYVGSTTMDINVFTRDDTIVDVIHGGCEMKVLFYAQKDVSLTVYNKVFFYLIEFPSVTGNPNNPSVMLNTPDLVLPAGIVITSNKPTPFSDALTDSRRQYLGKVNEKIENFNLTNSIGFSFADITANDLNKYL